MPLDALNDLLEDETGGVFFLPKHAEPREVQAAAKRAKFAYFHIEGRNIARKEQLLNHVATALRFPGYFGGNWDALEECLGDLSWRRGSAHVLLIEGGAKLPKADADALRGILRDCAEGWAKRGRPFFAVYAGGRNAAALPELFRPRA